MAVWDQQPQAAKRVLSRPMPKTLKNLQMVYLAGSTGNNGTWLRQRCPYSTHKSRRNAVRDRPFLPSGVLKTARGIAEEALPVSVARTVKTQAKRDATARKMKKPQAQNSGPDSRGRIGL